MSGIVNVIIIRIRVKDGRDVMKIHIRSVCVVLGSLFVYDIIEISKINSCSK